MLSAKKVLYHFESRLEAGLVLPHRRTSTASKRLDSLSGVLIYLNNFATFVISTLGAHAMLHARLLAVRTNHRLRNAQRIVRSALAAPRFRVTTFWIWHDYSTTFRFRILDFGFTLRGICSHKQKKAICNPKSKT
jgi:hypothetical protein